MINGFISSILLCFSLVGWGLFIFRKGRIHPGFIPLFLFSCITSLVFIAGVFHVMPQMVSVLFYSGLLLFVVYTFLLVRTKNHLNKLIVPATVSFVFFSILIVYQLQGVFYIHYDNFNHWSLIVKEMFRIDGLPDSSTSIQFRNYPPGSAVFIYFIGKITFYSEEMTLIAQGFLLTACFAVLLVFCHWKKPAHILLSLISCFVLIVIIKGNIYNLLVDTLLGLVATSITLIAYYYKNDWKKCVLTTAPILILLLLIKDSGKIFFFINVAIILLFVYRGLLKNNSNPQTKRKAISITLVFTVLFPLFTVFLWSYHINNAYPENPYETNKFAITLDRFKTIDKTEDVINQIGPELLAKSTDISSSNVQSIVLINIAAIILLIWSFLKYKKLPRNLVSTIIFSNIFYVTYILLLYLMYLYLMPANEAAYEAGFGRYQSTAVIYIIGILMTTTILEWSKLISHYKNSLLHLSSLLCLVTLFLYPFHDHISSIINKPDIENSIRFDILKSKSIVRSTGTKHSTILYYSPNSKDDHGYLRVMLNYENISRNYHIVTNLETSALEKNLINLMRQSDVMVVIDSDKNYATFTTKYEMGSGNEGVYKIKVTNGGVTLIPLQSKT